jgi:LCP family protein required for cell wall assembly
MSRIVSILTCAALCLLLAGCGDLASGAGGDQATRREGGTGKAATKAARPAPPPTPTPEPTREPLTVADLLGDDGRFTVLLLGSDLRKGIVGERTDAIIVATIDPGSGKVAMVSLPRDTVNVPIAPGEAYAERINTLYFDLQQSTGKRKTALEEMRAALAYSFGTEIDHVALVDFDGLVKLIDSIGGIDVTLDEPINDPTMHLGEKGLKLKAGLQRLDGKEALAYARSRHTSSDYDRSRRQQQVIAAAAEKVRSLGLGALPALVELVRKKTLSDIPMLAAPALLELGSKADLSTVRSVVLEPERWARLIPGGYTIMPRVIEVQKLFDRIFDEAG